MRPRARTLLAAALLLVVGVGIGLALTGGVSVDGSIVLGDPAGPEVEVITSNSEMVLDGSHGGAGTMEIVHDQGTIVFDGADDTAARVHESDIVGPTTSVTQIEAGSGLTINPADKPALDVGGGLESIEFAAMQVDDGEVDFSYVSTGSASVSVRETGAANEIVLAVAADGTVLDQTTTDAAETAVFSDLDSGEHDVSLATTSEPVLGNGTPSDGVTIQEPPVELSIVLEDDDFDRDHGDSVEVTFYDAADDSELDSDTLTSAGNATTTVSSPPGGENSWYAVAEDSYGNQVTSDTFVYNVPDELRIFNEAQPDQLITTEVPIRVRFFVDGAETVIERETTDGTVDLSGLPTDQRFVVTVRTDETDDFTYRRIVVESIIEQQEVYLLNRSEPHSEILFRLDDPTGDFPPEQTTLFVEKPITKDFNDDGQTTTRYEVMAGDVFGATGEYPVILQEDARYRLRVQAPDGDSSRILGFYSVTGPASTSLQIQRIEPSADSDAGSIVYGGLTTIEGQRALAVRYLDPDRETTQVEYRVLNASGEVWIEDTVRTSNEFADIYPLPADAGEDPAYIVEWTIVRDGEERKGSFVAGDIPEIAERLGINPHILGLLSWVAIMGAMGLVVIINASLAPLSGTGMATILTIMGMVSIPGPVLGVAGAVSVLVLFGGRG